MSKVTKYEDFYQVDLERRNLNSIPTHTDKTSYENNVYYLSYYNYYYGWYRVYTVFKRFEDGRTTIGKMASYDYEHWKNILQNQKGRYATFGLIEIQIIKPKIFNIECPY